MAGTVHHRLSAPVPTTPPDRPATIDDVLTAAEHHALHSVRVSFVDQHGLLRTKTIAAGHLAAVLHDGIGMTGSLLLKDTGNQYGIGVWSPSGITTLDALIGAQDMLLRPDPTTWRVLPWAAGTGSLLCDLFTTTGEPIPQSTRALCRRAVDELAALGHRMTVGLELECHLYDAVSGDPIHPGWDLLGERHADLVHDRLEPVRAGLTAIGLSPRSIEIELGPGQVELTFAASDAMTAADDAVVVRSAIGQLARRNGMRATFMCRPSPEAFPSGWHLHQSLTHRVAEGAETVNSFVVDSTAATTVVTPDGPEQFLSATGRSWVAGLLAHAAASCLLTTPTVNGYKRYRANSVAPDRIAWGRQHRGAMVRVIGDGRHPSTHVENRVGEPAANPYLYVASQVVSGIDGLRRSLDPPPPSTSPYEPDAGPLLPRSLGEAIEAFSTSKLYLDHWGDEVVTYLTSIKASEWHRFQAAVTDWEQREYSQLF